MVKMLFFLFLLSSKVFAGQGMVLVLEAPLLEQADNKSKVIDTLRKGEILWLHDRYFRDTDYQKVTLLEGEQGPPDREIAEYYETIDSRGMTAWIEASFVKLIYLDERELETSVDRFRFDPKDYRLEEPLADGYPLTNAEKIKASFWALMGSGHQQNYPYPKIVSSRTDRTRKGVRLHYLRRVEYDNYDRFYYGITSQIETETKKFNFENGVESNESHSRIGIGPAISYDIFRGEFWNFNLQGGFAAYYNRSLVSQSRDDLGTDDRVFHGLNFGGDFSASWLYKGFSENVYVQIGSGFDFQLPASLSPLSDETTIEDIWRTQDDSSRDVIEIPLSMSYNAFIGFTINYN